MAKTVRVNQRVAAVHNRRLTLRLLTRHGALSRKQLADLTGMHGSTLSNIMSEFLEMGIVKEIGKRESTGVGKKQTLVQINPDYGWVFGVGIHESHVDLMAINLRGDILDKGESQLTNGIQDLPGIVQSFMDATAHIPGILLGGHVGLPGTVDVRRGVILHSKSLALENYDLRTAMLSELNVAVAIGMDAAVATQAEALVSRADSQTSFALFYANCPPKNGGYSLTGFGVGLFIMGSVYCGDHQGAGKLAAPLLPDDYPGLGAEDMEALGDPDAPLTPRFEELRDWLVPHLVPIVSLVDPREIVMGGHVSWRNRVLLSGIGDALREHGAASYTTRFVRVRGSRLPKRALAYGAALNAILTATENLVQE